MFFVSHDDVQHPTEDRVCIHPGQIIPLESLAATYAEFQIDYMAGTVVATLDDAHRWSEMFYA